MKKESRIVSSGAYDGIPADVYHSPDVTPAPALSASGAKILLDSTPAHYRHKILWGGARHSRAFDVGTATHLLCLEPHLFAEQVQIIDASDYRTKLAQEARDAARAEGLTPLLEGEVATVRAMRDALWAHPVARLAFEGGIAERSYFWTDPETGVWLKARLDVTPPHGRYVVDLKTATTANPQDFGKRVAEYGYHISGAHYMEALRAVTGESPTQFYLIVIEKSPPHCVSVMTIDQEALQWGAWQMQRAIKKFALCLERWEWPGYDTGVRPIGLPTYALHNLESLRGSIEEKI